MKCTIPWKVPRTPLITSWKMCPMAATKPWITSRIDCTKCVTPDAMPMFAFKNGEKGLVVDGIFVLRFYLNYVVIGHKTDVGIYLSWEYGVVMM